MLAANVAGEERGADLDQVVSYDIFSFFFSFKCDTGLKMLDYNGKILIYLLPGIIIIFNSSSNNNIVNIIDISLVNSNIINNFLCLFTGSQNI